MKVIRDPVHGYIELDDLALSLIDTPQMQRLRRIRQLGFSHLVYPGANHTRFEHSLGVMHLANKLISQVDENHRLEMQCAAVLHDVGHGPFSHVTEELIKKYTRRGHEELEFLIKGGEIGEVLKDRSIKPSAVAKHVKGETHAGQILNSEIDVDRMDYLVRDSHYTGVAFGLIDHIRLLHELKLIDGKLVIKSGGLKAAESLLVSRFLMHPTVYFHHVSRIAETMCARAVEHMIENGNLEGSHLQYLDDFELIRKMIDSGGYPKEIADRLNTRRLFKRALYTGFDSVSKDVTKYRSSVKKVEKEIADSAGIAPEYVIVDIPEMTGISEMKAMVMIKEEMISIDKASHLVATLEEAQKDNWRLGVFTLKECREKVQDIARDFFEVKKGMKQFKLDTEY